MTAGRAALTLAIAISLSSISCKDDKPTDKGAPPPPPVAAANAGACASGGGHVGDPVSTEFFPRSVLAYCIDPQGETKTYGEKGKFTMDEVCTTAFDGECEVYKRLGLKRVVALRYVDGGGGGGSVEVNLSTFADVGGGYGMFTKRVIADADPADSRAPRPITAGGAGAIGSGRGYVWKGPYLAELTYINEQEAPDALIKSSEAILTALAKSMGEKLPGSNDKPASAKALPDTSLIANGVQFYPKDPLGFTGAGAGAVGFYKDGAKRFRMLSIVPTDADQAKDAMKAIRSRAGALPVALVGDEAVQVIVQDTPDRPKSEYVIARKGANVLGIGDEDLVPAFRLSKEEKVSRLRASLATMGTTATPALDAGKK